MDINSLPNELIYLILSNLTTSELHIIRETSILFQLIADDIAYTRVIKEEPKINRPISFNRLYPTEKIYFVNYNILRILAGMSSISYSN